MAVAYPPLPINIPSGKGVSFKDEELITTLPPMEKLIFQLRQNFKFILIGVVVYIVIIR